jgi:hypothetical protein
MVIPLEIQTDVWNVGESTCVTKVASGRNNEMTLGWLVEVEHITKSMKLIFAWPYRYLCCSNLSNIASVLTAAYK